MDKQTIQPPLEYCPLCKTNGKISKIIPFFINLDEAVYLCSEEQCQYPFGYDDFVFMPLDHLNCQEQLNICSTKHERTESDYHTNDNLSSSQDMSPNYSTTWNESLLSSLDFMETIELDDNFLTSQFEDIDSNIVTNTNEENLNENKPNEVFSAKEDFHYSISSKEAADTNYIIQLEEALHINRTLSPEKATNMNNIIPPERALDIKNCGTSSYNSDIVLPSFSTISKNNLKVPTCDKINNELFTKKCDFTESNIFKNQFDIIESLEHNRVSTIIDHSEKTVQNINKHSTNNVVSQKVVSPTRESCDMYKSISNIEFLLKSSTACVKKTNIRNPVLLNKLKLLPNFHKRHSTSNKKNVQKNNINIPNNTSSPITVNNTPYQSDIKISFCAPIDIQWENSNISSDLNDISISGLSLLSDVNMEKDINNDDHKNVSETKTDI